jgi:hypothetical protein
MHPVCAIFVYRCGDLQEAGIAMAAGRAAGRGPGSLVCACWWDSASASAKTASVKAVEMEKGPAVDILGGYRACVAEAVQMPASYVHV